MSQVTKQKLTGIQERTVFELGNIATITVVIIAAVITYFTSFLATDVLAQEKTGVAMDTTQSFIEGDGVVYTMTLLCQWFIYAAVLYALCVAYRYMTSRR